MSEKVKWIELDKIKPHPENPCNNKDEETIQQLTYQIKNEGFDTAHPLKVKSNNEYFIILGGHHRYEAAKKAEINSLPCVIKSELSELQEILILLKDNIQRKPSNYEFAKGVYYYTKKGGTVKDLAKEFGLNENTVTGLRIAAEVGEEILAGQDFDLSKKTEQLVHIHRLPQECWQEAVTYIMKENLAKSQVSEKVTNAKKGTTNKQIISLFTEKTTLRELKQIESIKTQVFGYLTHKDLQESWQTWFNENDPIDVKEVQNKRIELEDVQSKRDYKEEITQLPKIVLADPPWKYNFSKSDNRQIENQYPSANVEDIIKHRPNTQSDCILFLWTTAPKLIEALEVMEGWGFTYKTHAIWDKQQIGMGYWVRGQHELLLIGTKGNPNVPENKHSSIFSEKRGKHSEKPNSVYKWIEEEYSEEVKLEMYGRKKREKWIIWGNEKGE